MARALELAREAISRDEVPVGAVLVDAEGKVLAEASNRREELSQTAAHAEMLALESYNRHSLSWRLPEGSSLYVTVEPCLMCVGALLWARLDHVVYGCRDSKSAGLERIRELIETGVYDHRFKSINEGIAGGECAEVMSGYFREKRKLKKNQRQPAQTEMASSLGTSHAE